MKKKKIILIVVCGDTNLATCDPVVNSFKMTCTYTGLNFVGAIRISSASGKPQDNVAAISEMYSFLI